jgi:enolase-phosphatase E1
MPGFLASHSEDPEIQGLIEDAEQAWLVDAHPSAIALRNQSSGAASVTAYLQDLIDRDVKLTALKDLQGRIWRSGYTNGDLVAPLYNDVAESLEQWRKTGLVLAVYSSGSIPAQQLLYGHSSAGDLRGFFSHWFDTHTGSKHDPSSYTLIAETMECAPQAILFVSDLASELQAASQSGLQVVCSQRESDKLKGLKTYPSINTFHQIQLKLQHEQESL